MTFRMLVWVVLLATLAACSVEAYAHWAAMLAVGAALALGWHSGRWARDESWRAHEQWIRDVRASFDEAAR